MKNLIAMIKHLKTMIDAEEQKEPETAYSQGWIVGASFVLRSIIRAIKMDRFKEEKNESPGQEEL